MSTLYVDTITEKSSGNGVQIPGHVVQVVSSTYSTAGSTTSASPIQMWSGLSITPKFANSIIKVECNWFAVHNKNWGVSIGRFSSSKHIFYRSSFYVLWGA